ncbi:lipase family protein [soil metagenome]
MRGRSRWWLVPIVLAALVTTAGVVIWNAARPPEVTAFYDAPDELPSTEPGTLLRWESMESRDGHTLWRILYVSTDLAGEPRVVSGLIGRPAADAPEGGYPLIAAAHGTTGIAQGCAPSLMLYDGSDESPSLYDGVAKPFLDLGYAVVMADYQGLGVAGSPSYVIGQLEAQNVLDSIRAAQAFGELELNGQIVLQGHSQGGHAVAFTLQIAPEYAPELPFLGGVLLAPATDLLGMFNVILEEDERSPMSALVLYSLSAWGQTIPGADLSDVATSLGQDVMRATTDRTCVVFSALSATLFVPSRLIEEGATERWSEIIAANTPDAGPWKQPVFIGQGGSDGVILPTFTNAFVEGLCMSGTMVEYRMYPDATHFSVPKASQEDMLAWVAGRFAGNPATSNC